MLDFKNKVIYQIYPKSFKDSNQDGLGDIGGIIEKIDYLKTLGVECLWITPFFVSPQKDNGYDVADYFSIDPAFGSMEDIELLITEAEKRDIIIMLDMVFNHTSTQHEWFQKAMQGEQKYIDYYIFKEGKPNKQPTNWESKFGGSAWEYVPHLKKWYLHLFDKSQADLNWENPNVREELKKVILFWKEKGVKGFRFDVVNLISKPDQFEDDWIGDGRRFYTDGPHVHKYLKELVRDTGIDNMITVGEMSSTTIDNCIRYSNPRENELTMCFNFHHLKVDYKDANKWEVMQPDFMELKKILTKWQLEMQKHGGWNALFWCNHDQPRVVSRFGEEGIYWEKSAKMLATAIHMLQGTPYIYQGEELGMTNAHFSSINQYKDVESLNYYQIMLKEGKSEEEALHILAARSRDNGRTPMQWSSEKYGGFSKTVPWLSITDNYVKINAKEQEKDSNSIYHYYRQLIRLRKEKTVIAEGKIAFLYENHPDIFVYKRFDDKEELLVFLNLKNHIVELENMQELSKYKKLIGNYDKTNYDFSKFVLHEYETVVFEKVIK